MNVSHGTLSRIMGYLAATALVIAAAGCYQEESGPDNVPGTLRQITRGELLSMNGRYLLSTPDIIVLDEHMGIVRDGDLLEFIVGGSLEAKLEAYRDGDFTLVVRRGFSPYVHLSVEKIMAGRDTVLVPERRDYDWPILLDAGDYDLSPFEDFDLSTLVYDKKKKLKPLVGKKMNVEGSIRFANLDGEFYYVLEAIGNPKALVRLDEDEPGMLLILKALLHENLRFRGGITFNEVANWGALRKPYKISGLVSIDYVRYGGRIVTVPRAATTPEDASAD